MISAIGTLIFLFLGNATPEVALSGPLPSAISPKTATDLVADEDESDEDEDYSSQPDEEEEDVSSSDTDEENMTDDSSIESEIEPEDDED